ncbi:MAG TPA: hypothetical protein PLV21_00880 [Cyclobacteriaceae bacterium]|nr:hypothetical protein [Cyclobacteriaceae bacterium]HRJ80407.1 hypothetical protein [Cyclobacteriaceae bacterium]
MNSKLTTYILLAIIVVLAGFAYYTSSQVNELKKEATVWKAKYEEALEDMEDAFKRLEEKDVQLKTALEEAQMEKLRAEEALRSVQKSSRK